MDIINLLSIDQYTLQLNNWDGQNKCIFMRQASVEMDD